MEDTWSTIILPMSESHFAQKPLVCLKEGDYSHFDARYGIDPNDAEIQRHIAWTRQVISHLVGLVGSDVKVTLEIQATMPSGASDNVVRIVTENSRTLKFTSHGFEKD